MKAVLRKNTKPYCTCTGGSKGFTKPPGPNTYWVHPDCLKVTRTVWERHGGIPMELFP